MNHFTPIIWKSLYTHLDINYNSQIPTTESISNVFPDNPVKFKAHNNFSSSFKFYTDITVINYLVNKIDALKGTCTKLPIDILCVDEIKLDSWFPDSQFYISGCQFLPFHKDKSKYREVKQFP